MIDVDRGVCTVQGGGAQQHGEGSEGSGEDAAHGGVVEGVQEGGRVPPVRIRTAGQRYSGERRHTHPRCRQQRRGCRHSRRSHRAWRSTGPWHGPGRSRSLPHQGRGRQRRRCWS